MIHRRSMIKSLAYSTAGSLLAKHSRLLASGTDQRPTKNIKNPLIDGPGMSDPHVLVENDVCYIFSGHDAGFGNSEWVMPDWRVHRSTDLRSWKHVGTILPKDNYMGKGNTDCWAGDIVKRHNKYYWFFSNRDKNTGVMMASKPEGPYADALGKPLVTSYDPTVFTDDDNTPYLIWGTETYKIARLKDSLLELDEEPREIAINRTSHFPFLDKNALHKHRGLYYLSCSGYYATSKNIYGPYETQGRVGEGWGLETGWAHGEFFVWKGNWYHIWCRYRDRSYDKIRDCFIAPVSYDEKGLMHDDLSQLDDKYR